MIWSLGSLPCMFLNGFPDASFDIKVHPGTLEQDLECLHLVVLEAPHEGDEAILVHGVDVDPRAGHQHAQQIQPATAENKNVKKIFF